LFSRYHYTEFGEVPVFLFPGALDRAGLRIMKLTHLKYYLFKFFK
jgi:hypothetical protein